MTDSAPNRKARRAQASGKVPVPPTPEAVAEAKVNVMAAAANFNDMVWAAMQLGLEVSFNMQQTDRGEGRQQACLVPRVLQEV